MLTVLDGVSAIVVLIFGIVATACCIVRNLEVKIKWTTRTLVLGMYSQGELILR